MKQNVRVGAVFAVAVVVCAVGWIMLPRLNGSPSPADRRASVQLERARRLFHRYHAGLDHRQGLMNELREMQVDVDAQDQQKLLDAAEDDYRERHGELWKLYSPTEWGDDPEPARPSYGNLSGQIRAGMQARKELVADNGKLLEAALDAVDEALAVQSEGGADQLHPESLRLKSAILLHIGLRHRRIASQERQVTRKALDTLTDCAMDAEALISLRHLVAGSGVDNQLQVIRTQLSKEQATLDALNAEWAMLDAQIRDAEGKYQAARGRAEHNRNELEALVNTGTGSSALGNEAALVGRMSELDEAYRSSAREAQVMMFGDYTDAFIDDSGDYLTGVYVKDGARASEYRFGLVHDRADRAVAAKRREIAQLAVGEIRADLARLEVQRNALVTRQDRALQELGGLRSKAREAYSEYKRARTAVAASDEKAIKLFDQSTSVAKQAAAAAAQWVSSARERAQAVPDEVRDRSVYTKRSQGTWMAGFSSAQEADGRLAKAWIYADQYRSAVESLRTFELAVKNLELADLNVSAVEEVSQTAQEAGLTAVNQAVIVLEKSFRDTGRHWTLVAQQAGAIYVLTLLGHPGFAADATETYRNSVKGREDKPFAQRIVARLKQLEASQ